MKELFLYTDESGNTGHNLFDDNQPYYKTGTLICENNFEKRYKSKIDTICRKNGIGELHGNKIGLHMVELIARDLIDILANKDIKLFFVHLDKKYLAKVKLFDLLFDSGLNEAVNPMNYYSRGLRFPLLLNFIQLIDDDLAKKFWTYYESPKNVEFIEILKVIYAKLQINYIFMNDRVFEIITDAISWAEKHPDIFTDSPRTKYDSPNTVAFALILNNLNSIYYDKNIKIVEFIHDEQNQFSSSFKEIYGFIKDINPSYSAFSTLLDNKKSKMFNCEFTTKKSENTSALQFIDTLLWIYKISDEKELGYNTQILKKLVLKKSEMTIFDTNMLINETNEMAKEMNRASIPEEELVKGKILFSAMEKQRKARITE